MTPPAAGLPSVAAAAQHKRLKPERRAPCIPIRSFPAGCTVPRRPETRRRPTRWSPGTIGISISSALRLEHVTRPRAVYVSYRSRERPLLDETKTDPALRRGVVDRREERSSCALRQQGFGRGTGSGLRRGTDCGGPRSIRANPVPEQLRSQSLSEWEQPASRLQQSSRFWRQSFVIRPLRRGTRSRGSPALFPTLDAARERPQLHRWRRSYHGGRQLFRNPGRSCSSGSVWRAPFCVCVEPALATCRHSGRNPATMTRRYASPRA